MPKFIEVQIGNIEYQVPVDKLAMIHSFLKNVSKRQGVKSRAEIIKETSAKNTEGILINSSFAGVFFRVNKKDYKLGSGIDPTVKILDSFFSLYEREDGVNYLDWNSQVLGRAEI